MAILVAVEKWRHYLEAGPFIIKTDHYSLKYLLQQKISTQLQKKSLTKLLGLTYQIHYKKRREREFREEYSCKIDDDSNYNHCISNAFPNYHNRM